jgi:large subunit ribosomal protein L4
MANCVVQNWQGENVGEVTLELKVASEATAASVVHRALHRQLHNERQGTVSTKTRSEVRGGGRKPWKQKGTGRARAGSNRSPLWRKGGVTFGPRPRDFYLKMNRKERRLALRTAFQGRADDLIVVEDFADQLPRPKTKELASAIARWGGRTDAKILLIVAERNEMVYLSVRNMAQVKLMQADQLNVSDLLTADQIITTQSAIDKIQEVYSA